MSEQPHRRASASLLWPLMVLLLAFSGYAVRSAFKSYANNAARGLEDELSTQPFFVSSKIHKDKGKQYLWAKGPKIHGDDASEWFNMTGSPLKLEEINHGIGRDTIPSIDNPVFVKPDDPRLRRRWGKNENANIDDLRVIGYEHNGVARAYPIKLLNRHELVNDTVAGTPVTVGW